MLGISLYLHHISQADLEGYVKMPYCPNCGVKVGKTANFCTKCGFDLKAEAEKVKPEVSSYTTKCANHPERDAVGTCVDCGREICILCRTVMEDKFYCPSCTYRILNEPVRKADKYSQDVSAVPSQELSMADTPIVITRSWWGRHLGWTLFLGEMLISALIAILVIIDIVIYNVALDSTSDTTAEIISLVFFLILFIGILVYYFRLRIWYLRAKSRSLWFLAFGFVVLLLLENKSIESDKVWWRISGV